MMYIIITVSQAIVSLMANLLTEEVRELRTLSWVPEVFHPFEYLNLGVGHANKSTTLWGS